MTSAQTNLVAPAKRFRSSIVFGVLMICCTLSGCAAWTNPVANGIPVRLIPDELLAESKEDFESIPWGILQREQEEKPLLRAGDALGVYIEGVIGSDNDMPPISFPEDPSLPPSLGYPITIRSDGTIPLPWIKPPKVVGITIEEAEAKILEAYTKLKNQRILVPGQTRLIVTLARPKTNSVTVIRQDAAGSRGSIFQPTERGLLGNPISALASTRQGTGFTLQLPPNQSDLLNALSRTGGLPGVDAKDMILIYRKAAYNNAVTSEAAKLVAEPQRVQLKVRKGEKPQISRRDIELNEGDLVVIESRDAELYYTTGLLRNQEVPLPADSDLNAVQAIARVGGPLVNGGFGGANLTGSIVSLGLGAPSPSLLTVLRKGPDDRLVPIRVDLNEAMRDPRENILIQAGDMLVLQETTGEAFTRYMSNVFNFNAAGNIISRGDLGVSGSASVP